MPKFFRNFRIKSIELSKVKNYLLYAVGEIVLVVAGILIAVKVGDLSKEQEFKAALKVVERDLQEDVTNINSALESWRRSDSLSHRILEGKITREDLIQDSTLLTRAILLRYEIAIHSNGFKAVNRMLENKPTGYDAILESLNKLMDQNAGAIEHFQTDMREISTDYYVCQRDNQHWNWTRFLNQSEAVERDYLFYQKDMRYKNWVAFHLTKQHSLMIALNRYRELAINVLFELQRSDEQQAPGISYLQKIINPKPISLESCPEPLKAIDLSSIIKGRDYGMASLTLVKNQTKDTLHIYGGASRFRGMNEYAIVVPRESKVLRLPLNSKLYFFRKDACIGSTTYTKYNQSITIK